MKKAKVGQQVTWTIDRKRNPLRLVGQVEAINGEWAKVRANGTLHTVHLHVMRSAHLCVVCGKLTQRGTEFYCSPECYGADMTGATDDLVFESIVKFKADNDGCSPTTSDIMRLSRLGEGTVMRSIRRMRVSGRIRLLPSGQNWRIVIPGGRWVYEGKEVQLANAT